MYCHTRYCTHHHSLQNKSINCIKQQVTLIENVHFLSRVAQNRWVVMGPSPKQSKSALIPNEHKPFSKHQLAVINTFETCWLKMTQSLKKA